MHKLIVPALVCALAPLALAADAKQQLAEKLLEASGSRKGVEDTLEKTSSIMLRRMGDTSRMTPATKVKMEAAVARISALMKAEMGWEKMKPEMIRLYVENYTEAEMKAAIAFYQSPEGAAFTAKSAIVNARTSEWSMKQVGALAPQIQAIVREEMGKPDAAPAPAAK